MASWFQIIYCKCNDANKFLSFIYIYIYNIIKALNSLKINTIYAVY
jgi:hypothetical protein